MHIPVLVDEVLGALAPKPGDVVVDATLGDGGHAKKIISAIIPGGTFIGIDRDKEAIKKINESLHNTKSNITFFALHGSYRDIDVLVESSGYSRVDAILFDLGLSSDQLIANRGFSFQEDAPLDMRFNTDENIPTVADIVNGSTAEELADIFWRYGDERSSRKIAKAITERRKKQRFKTTQDLVNLVTMVKSGKSGRINPATKVFQALRIVVNDELAGLREVLPKAVKILKPGGRIAVISYHSLEDRIVKQFFKDISRTGVLNIITKKPISPTRKEILHNPRSRSAKLRVAIKNP